MMQIYPFPYKDDSKESMFEFGASLKADICFGISGELLQELWSNFTFGKSNLLLEERRNDGGCSICFGDAPVQTCTEGMSYVLEVDLHGVCIAAHDHAGLMQGFMSLLQLIRPVSLADGAETFCIEGCRIEDKPGLRFRGIHLCLFPGMELFALQKIIRLCAFMKYSHIILEFWGSLRFDCLPELAWENGFTKDEIRPILQEAKALGVEMVPMFNHLGHASQSRARYGKHVVLDQDPGKALLFEPDGWTWNIRNPETLAILAAIREELLDLFGEGEYFHLGFDEAHVFAEDLDSEARNELLLDYMNSLCEELCRRGRRPMIWGDMFLEHKYWAENPPEKGRYSATSFEEYRILPRLDKRFLVTDWQYYMTEGEIKTNRYFEELGFEVLPCPWNNYDNLGNTVCEAKTHGMAGMLQTTWGNLQEDIIVIPYSGSAMWDNACRRYSKEELGVIRIKAMHFIRKLLPSGGRYDRAGWKENEV